MNSNFPPNHGKEREEFIFNKVLSGESDFDFINISHSDGNNEITLSVFRDALKIDGMRVCVSAETQQKIADIVGCSLLTPKIADLIWINRDISIPPLPRKISSSTQAMISHSSDIDTHIKDLIGLVSNTGKHWVIDNALEMNKGRAMNYGWHFLGNKFQGILCSSIPSGLKENGNQISVIQGRGTAHDIFHSDYSQTCVLVSKICKINGNEMDLHEVLQDEELSELISHQGPLKILRQPGVEEIKGVTVLAPTKIQIDNVIFQTQKTS